MAGHGQNRSVVTCATNPQQPYPPLVDMYCTGLATGRQITGDADVMPSAASSGVTVTFPVHYAHLTAVITVSVT